MKKLVVFFLILSCMPIVYSQYTENHKKFVLGNITDKINIITQNSVQHPDYDLLRASLLYCIESSAFLPSSPDLKNLLLKTLAALEPCVTDDFSPILLQVYKTYSSQDILIPLFHCMAGIRISDKALIQDMYDIVRKEMEKYFSQRSHELIMASVRALGATQDANLFNNLFPYLFLELDADVSALIFSVLSQSMQHYKTDAIKIIANDNLHEKRVILDLAVKSTATDDFFKAEIAENILSSTINHIEDATSTSRESMELQLDAMRVIKNMKWTRSSLLMTTYFTSAQAQYAASQISREELIEIIECLAALATNETGKALTEYLGILNDKTEKSGTFDEVLLLSVIQSIGKLGEKSAFDNLLYVILYQGYTDTIISASKEALSKLNW